MLVLVACVSVLVVKGSICRRINSSISPCFGASAGIRKLRDGLKRVSNAIASSAALFVSNMLERATVALDCLAAPYVRGTMHHHG